MQEKVKNRYRISISVIIVTFNNVRTILPCLVSLQKAFFQYHSQVFVIDNASSDDTISVLRQNQKSLSQYFSEFSLCLNDTNLGFTRAVNQGLKLASGDFVLLLNPDVVLQNDTIEKLLTCFSQENKIGVVAPQLRFANGKIQPSCRTFPRKRDVILELSGLAKLFPSSNIFNHWRMPDFDHQETRDVEQPQGAFLLARQKVLQQVGLLDERFPMFFSDVDWCRRIVAGGWRIRFCSGAFVMHLQGHSVFQRRGEMIVSSHRSFVAYFKKYDETFLQHVGSLFIALILYIILLPRILIAVFFQDN
ncbi:MAG: glycosyltransferase family 2 protein [Calditrichaeota bacterium]|nr:glycosyltransferase family 2 protein [Calditrichota bacterium]